MSTVDACVLRSVSGGSPWRRAVWLKGAAEVLSDTQQLRAQCGAESLPATAQRVAALERAAAAARSEQELMQTQADKLTGDVRVAGCP